MAFVDAHRKRWGIEPICETLQVAPSTYYAARSRPPSQRSIDDAALADEITRVWKQNYEVYGVRCGASSTGRASPSGAIVSSG